MFFYLIARIVNSVIGIYMTILIIRMVLDWIAVLARNWHPTGIIRDLIGIVYQLTDPPLRWLRQYIKPIWFGSFGLDVSFIVLYFALYILQILI
ncbi:YggT family protein [uncultured Bifidobacterium sp.]|uniref:YggT family protein n=1 Tax=uncultured Bifidobacterium sp. TaxID=165187 RepID=UPI002621BE9B|nr:YggT family protein [uncultured Bifidobacterium sp.]